MLSSPVLQVLEGKDELPGFASLGCGPGPINCADTAFCLTSPFLSSPAAAQWAVRCAVIVLQAEGLVAAAFPTELSL